MNLIRRFVEAFRLTLLRLELALLKWDWTDCTNRMIAIGKAMDELFEARPKVPDFDKQVTYLRVQYHATVSLRNEAEKRINAIKRNNPL
ncbi:MAG: hypothetical protein A3C49_03235 [Candidatus Doudnabacteria bacterium RIFCSPHIGHO2_02_FULL_42_25]|uniref:Uncharacterized protein n=1 Tax=Candidatus Doudnabacteria bacterium RIFCSPHIGHO2_01_FULL_41_86 TaxID=1817821 RepID=A0A1F5NA20_9BACT|nr:MAG: hypothetical protein A2717_02830 [Candidatus Doudnabacteria bacterium RIFCSPHIGHO2_01_FULL_41_86]OGE85483.1 MAG: hypothetical protein A3E28_02400 [Candidatus Doudnabacteria bacterium RIFCSPHIGHO2_12_FULL_42_22]OGE87021.1 MAG: hypothetical protein A3C49_03235 [Candidatus Doudnabacteria bacterium RIFCSPHIGHO2_02_FULL_42_25]OGE92620.1 MAG: hypothetical protein A2895_03390 [Candidatus Doudnabacteria bacterium RIFCSPLOWO2_01_FULL_42_60]OGE98781.1 MAG: hypothetical protein A3G89_04615 [Candid